ncbi:MAG TPA: HD domain-containing protein [Vicinamibacterales bacterium]|nr:HD domain-containing protein [Vicinamibacterales bacterium]
MARLPKLRDLESNVSGWGFFLCTRKDHRSGRTGSAYLEVGLQDASGEIGAKLFQDVETMALEFDAGEFVKLQGRSNLYQGRLEIILDKIRRIIPDRDAADGFREEDCIRCAPRPVDDMWAELLGRVDSISDPHLRRLLRTLVNRHADRLRVWPAARSVHHAYRSGLLEHILSIMSVVAFLADQYSARRDLLLAGALLHDIGKLQELSYETSTDYTVEGNLVGHIVLGVGMLRDAARELGDVPAELLIELEHLILSHHGELELGSPVKPRTVEAFLLATADDLDAKMHQIRQHLEDDESPGRFTAYHKRLDRSLLKPSSS